MALQTLLGLELLFVDVLVLVAAQAIDRNLLAFFAFCGRGDEFHQAVEVFVFGGRFASVARAAGNRCVPAQQRHPRPAMVEPNLGPPGRGQVAHRALADFLEPALVQILVARIAIFGRRPRGRLGVARRARLSVRPFQGKPRLVRMVKIDRFPFHFRAVAQRAFLLSEQRAPVYIFVARCAVGGPVRQTKQRARVATVARRSDVFAFQREARVGRVVKLQRLDAPPVFFVVAAFARGNLPVHVSVRMFRVARRAIGRGQKKARASGLRFLFVTVLALHHGVPTLQREAAQRVVRKLLLPAQSRPTEQICVKAPVLLVAQHARPAQRLLRPVQPAFLRHPVGHGLVAIQALLFVDFALVRWVTLGAVRRAVDVRVPPRQLARRRVKETRVRQRRRAEASPQAEPDQHRPNKRLPHP